MYTAEGKRIMDQIWKETMSELEFAGVQEILGSISSSR